MEKIFKSWINLSFCNEQFEIEFQKSKDEKIKRTIKSYTLMILILTIIASIINSFYYKHYDFLGFKIILFTSYVITILYILLYYLSLKWENMSYLRILNYANFYFILFCFADFRYPLVYFNSSNPIIFFNLVLVEISFRLIWVTHGVLGFAETLVIIIITIISNWSWIISFFLAVPNFSINFLFITSYTSMIVLFVLFAYFLERYHKQYYYYFLLGEKKNLWFNNIFDNMHTGLLSIKGQNLTYINSFLFEKILKIKNFKEKIRRESDFTELNILGISEKKENTERIDYLKPYFKSILKGLITNIHNDILSNYYLLIFS